MIAAGLVAMLAEADLPWLEPVNLRRPGFAQVMLPQAGGALWTVGAATSWHRGLLLAMVRQTPERPLAQPPMTSRWPRRCGTVARK